MKLCIPANGKFVFAPGGCHLMLMRPRRPLHADDQATVNFVFADKSTLRVIFKVRKDMPTKGE